MNNEIKDCSAGWSCAIRAFRNSAKHHCCCLSAGVQENPILDGDEQPPVSLCQLDVDTCHHLGMRSLLPLKNLQALNIKSCTLGAAALAQLASLPNLTSLQLGFTDPQYAAKFAASGSAASPLSQFTALKHLGLGVPQADPAGSVWSHYIWPADPLRCIAGLTSLSSLSIWLVNAAPQELAAAITPLTALTTLLLHPRSSWLYSRPARGQPARSAEDDAEHAQRVTDLVDVLASLPKLCALHINFAGRLTQGQKEQLAHVPAAPVTEK